MPSAPTVPGEYRLTGPAVDVLDAVVDAHRRGQLGYVTRPTRCQPGHVAARVRIVRARRSRGARVAAITTAAAVVLVVVAVAGVLAAQWAVAHAAGLAGLSALARGLVWLARREER